MLGAGDGERDLLGRGEGERDLTLLTTPDIGARDGEGERDLILAGADGGAGGDLGGEATDDADDRTDFVRPLPPPPEPGDSAFPLFFPFLPTSSLFCSFRITWIAVLRLLNARSSVMYFSFLLSGSQVPYGPVLSRTCCMAIARPSNSRSISSTDILPGELGALEG